MFLLALTSAHFDAAQSRHDDPIQSVVILHAAYEERGMALTLRQLLRNLERASDDVERRYEQAATLRTLDDLERELDEVDGDYAAVEQALNTTGEDQMLCGSCPELFGGAAQSFDDAREARMDARDQRDALGAELRVVWQEGDAAVATLDLEQLAESIDRFDALWRGPHPIRQAWDTCRAVLEQPASPSANLEALDAARSPGSLPPSTLAAMEVLEADLRDRAAQAAEAAAQAKRLEERRRYPAALEAIEAAYALDREPWAERLEYSRLLVEGVEFIADGDPLRGIQVLARAAETPSSTGASRELRSAAARAVADRRRGAASASATIEERAMAIRELDAIAWMTGTVSPARPLEQALADSLPSLEIRYDLARTNNDRGSHLYRLVQDALEDTTADYGAELRQAEVLDQMATYSGIDGRPLDGQEVFLVSVDIVDFDAEISVSRETDSVEYLDGYDSYQVPNPEYAEWQDLMDQCGDLDTTYDSDLEAIVGGATAGLCAGAAMNPPSRTLTAKEPRYATCTYRTTRYDQWGIAEARLEAFHAPDGSIYVDETYEARVEHVLTETEAVRGDCRAAGVSLSTLAERPTTKALREMLLSQIEEQVRPSLEHHLRPTVVTQWMQREYADQHDYGPYALGAVYAEAGMGGLLLSLGAGEVIGSEAPSDLRLGFEATTAGARITSISADGPLGDTRLRVGDVVVAVDGISLEGSSAAMDGTLNGSRHPTRHLRVLRQGAGQPIDVTADWTAMPAVASR